MRRTKLILAFLVVALASPAAAQVSYRKDDSQVSLNLRLLRATMFCMKWVDGSQVWNAGTLEMEDVDGAPTPAKQGEAWDSDHNDDLGVVALEPRSAGCKVIMRTDKWDKSVPLSQIFGWLQNVAKYSVAVRSNDGQIMQIILSKPGGFSAMIKRYATRPVDDQPDAGADAFIMFYKD